MILSTRNGLFEGFLFMGMGMYFAFRPVNLKMSQAVMGLAGSLVLLTVEGFGVRELGWVRANDMYLSLIFTSFFLLWISLHLPLKERKAYIWLRHQGTLLFYLHIPVKVAVMKTIAADNSLVRYLQVVALSMILAQIFMALSRVKGLGWVKNLYG